MSLSRLVARPMLASIFLVGASAALKNAELNASRAKPVLDKVVPPLKQAGLPIPEDPALLVRINAGVQVAGALGLATGRAPRLSAAVLAASLVPTTAAGHRYWEAEDPTQKTQQKLHFFKNVSVLGGLIIAAGDTDGKPGVAWRTRHAAKEARREAKHLAASARREAKLAKARVS